MKIIIGADLVPTESNYDIFKNGDVNALIGQDLIKLFNEADYKIFNLEVPLTDKKNPINKCGENLIAPTTTITGIKNIGVDLFTLSNNHILDQDISGLNSTINVLKKNGIAYTGVGKTAEEAAKPYAFEIKGRQIGVYACAEHEFSIIGDFKEGVNPFDSLETPDHIAALKTKCDYVIVLYHGGKEHYRYPSPVLQKSCRKMVEKGADLVICQHSHCIGCKEEYKNGTIVYGQGNFIFDDENSEYWQTSILISVDENFKISYIPIVKTENKVRKADDEKGKEILDAFYKRSEEIKKPGFIEKSYCNFSESYIESYLYIMMGKKSIFFRALNKFSGNWLRHYIIKKKYENKQLLSIRNCVECEAHRELVIMGLKNKVKEYDK